jgi:CRP-like cAMP-binding protein
VAEQLTRTDIEQARVLLGECALFRGLRAEQKQALVAQARMRKVAAGQTIFLMGSEPDSMMAVLRGAVKVSVTSADGKELLLAVLQPGEVFGEIALLDGKERTADATAMDDATLAVLERRHVLAFLHGNPDAWQRLVEVLCSRLRSTDEHLAEVALLQLPARLAKALLRASAGKASAGAPIALSQRALGNMVGATREGVNKCLQEWRRAGIVRIDRAGIAITDRDALEDLSEQD